MGNINDKLIYLNDTKDLIREAIKNKGIKISASDTFRSYVDKINNISGGQNFIVENGIKFGYSNIPIYEKYNFSNVTDGKYLFRNSHIVKAPTLLNLTGSASRLFENCAELTECLYYIGAPSDMGNMFYGCSKLRQIDRLDFKNANECYQMFMGCSNLTNMTLENFGKFPGMDINKSVQLQGCNNWGNDTLASQHGLKYAKRSLTNSLMKFSFDRLANGLPKISVSLSRDVINRLTYQEKSAIVNKGYTLVAV